MRTASAISRAITAHSRYPARMNGPRMSQPSGPIETHVLPRDETLILMFPPVRGLSVTCLYDALEGRPDYRRLANWLAMIFKTCSNLRVP